MQYIGLNNTRNKDWQNYIKNKLAEELTSKKTVYLS